MERFISKKVTSEELAILDNNSEWLGISKSKLMECAGYTFANELIERKLINKGSKVVIFCGLGNNGGDGFVVARHLSSFGCKILVLLMGFPNNIRTREAKMNWDILKNLDYSIQTLIIKDSSNLDNVRKLINRNNLIVDALLGTGIEGKIREPISSAIDLINELKSIESLKVKVASIDVPSGLNPNTGAVSDKAVHSDITITLHRIKKGMKKNTKYIEELVEKSIGIPQEASFYVGRGDLLPTLKKRKVDTHKGEFGRVLVIGGSKNYSGAPAYTSLTAIHFGCDLVITYVPEVIGDVLRSYSPNMIVRTSHGKWLNTKALEEIKLLIDWANTIIIGPGLGTEKETYELLVELLSYMNAKRKNYVLDADALKLIKECLDLIKGQNVILTPHEAELRAITDKVLPSYDSIEERGNTVFKIAKELNVTILVKGPYDYISNGKLLKVNRTGCPEMSIGGTGDVLAGLCGSFLTTGNDLFKSACSAAFLNGFLGEYCKKNVRTRFNTMDMIDNLEKAILEIQKN